MDDIQHLVNENYHKDSLNYCAASGSDAAILNHLTVDVSKIDNESSDQQLHVTKNENVNDTFMKIDNGEIIKINLDTCDLTNTDNTLRCDNNEVYQNNTCIIDKSENKCLRFGHSVKEDSKTSESSKSITDSNALRSLLAYGDTSSSSSDDDDNNNNDDDDAVSNEGQNSTLSNINCDNSNNSGVKTFGDMSLRFPRVQRIIDDDLLSLSSSSSSDSSTSLIFSVNSDVSDDDYDDEFDICDERGTKNNKDKKNDKTTVAEGNHKKPTIKKKEKPSVTKGELLLEDLPAIKDLHITVPQDQCVLLGNILNIVDKLVIVQALKDLPALDLDTVLFLEWDKPLGKVFDVFGPVIEPLYCIRFNSNEHVQTKNISVGMPVYFVPKYKCTKYVFVAQLMKMKGSDASWENNNEPPLEFLEYSDDEQERNAKKHLKRISRKKKESDDTERKHPTAYEKRMNQRNLKMSEIQMRQSRNKKSRKQRNQLIRPSTFTADSTQPDSNRCTNSVSPWISDIDVKPFTDFERSIPPPQQNNTYHNVNSVPLCSPRLLNYSESISHQPFQYHCDQKHNLIPNRPPPPSPWSIPPTTMSANNFAYSQRSPAFPSSIFSSPPLHFHGMNNTPEKPIISQGPTSYHRFNNFSSPPPNFPNSNPRFSSPPCNSGFSINPTQGVFSPFLSFCGNNEMVSPSFCQATPPPNSTNLFSSPPPPPLAPLPQNINHNVMNSSSPFPFSNSFNGNFNSDAASNLSQTFLPGRLPLPPQQNSSQNQLTFQRNHQ